MNLYSIHDVDVTILQRADAGAAEGRSFQWSLFPKGGGPAAASARPLLWYHVEYEYEYEYYYYYYC